MNTENMTVAQLDADIRELEAFLKENKLNPAKITDCFGDTMDFLVEVLPAALIPAMFGVEMISEISEAESKGAKVALTALSLPLVIPSFALSALLCLPFAAITLPTSAVIEGVTVARHKKSNKRIKKAMKRLDELKEKRKELTGRKY